MSRWIGGDVKPNGNDRFTKVLLHFDGNVNDDNAGGSAHAWTATNPGGSPTVSGSAKFGSASASFPNLGSSALHGWTTPDSSDFHFGSLDFTVDFWWNLTSTQGKLAGQMTSSAGVFWTLEVVTNPLVIRAQIKIAGSFVTLTGSASFDFDEWHHLAFVRSGAALILFHDGVSVDSDSVSGSADTPTSKLSVGRAGDYAGANGFNGMIDEFRLSVGIARWTSNFTPPTRSYTRFLGSSS